MSVGAMIANNYSVGMSNCEKCLLNKSLIMSFEDDFFNRLLKLGKFIDQAHMRDKRQSKSKDFSLV